MKIRLALASTTVILVAGACVYPLARTPGAEVLRMPEAEPPTDVDSVEAELWSAVEDPAAGTSRQSPVTQGPLAGDAAVRGTDVLLRVTLEGIPDEFAPNANVTVTGVEAGDEWPRPKVQDSWPRQGLTNEFDLNPFFARAADWMIELPAAGAEEVELVIPVLAEVNVSRV